jgi:hypothetical protein
MFPVELTDCYLQQQTADLAPAPIKSGNRHTGAFGYLGHSNRSRLFFRQQCGGDIEHRSLVACRSAARTWFLHGSMA